MAETLDDAIREAKVAAGLDPEQRYPAYEFCDFLDEAWAQPFWERSLSIVIAREPLMHDFLPVRGHPDDDECTFRADGTDATYCGEPEAAHHPA